MWVVFSLFAVLWVLSVNLYMPIPMVIALFAAVISSAAMAVMPAKGHN